jgi:S-adenosylmethionine:tRNA ribosyltransferase-isomerase
MRFRDIIEVIQRGDILVMNRSRVIPARVPARKSTGGKAEVLLLERSGEHSWEALVGGRKVREGAHLATGDDDVSVRIDMKLQEGRSRITFLDHGREMPHPDTMEWLKAWGLMPTPPYIKRFLEDPEEYQTVYGDIEGSVAAPTAGLHFTNDLIERLRSKGVRIEMITLHVGLGTFAPVKTGDINDHVMEEEYFIIPKSARESIKEAVERKRVDGENRIWAVGTTSMRTMESAFDGDGNCIRESGRTGLFITPGYRFKLPYKGFITNFHLPRSTPLMLVSAFHDRARTLEAYREAVEMDYRFYSLGDSMMIRRG